jgi:hypothetical protein
MFTAGCELGDPAERGVILERILTVERTGMVQVSSFPPFIFGCIILMLTKAIGSESAKADGEGLGDRSTVGNVG